MFLLSRVSKLLPQMRQECFNIDLRRTAVTIFTPVIQFQSKCPQLNCSHRRSYKTSNNRSVTGGWWSNLSFFRKQVLILSSGILACSLVAIVDWFTWSSRISEEERLERAENVRTNGIIGTLVKATGVRDSLMVGMVGGAVSWVATFFFTNNPRQAATALFISTGVISIGFWFLHIIGGSSDQEEEDFKSALKKRRESLLDKDGETKD